MYVVMHVSLRTYSPNINTIIKVHGAHLNIASLGLDLFEATQCYAVNNNMYATVRECCLWVVEDCDERTVRTSSGTDS